jgi:hypothetical protein
MDFKRFKNINVNIRNIDVKINPTVWDKQPTLYSSTVVIDCTNHRIDIVRCGYIGLIFLLIDGQPTFQLYGSKKTISENINSLNLPNEIVMQILKFAEYSD